MKKSILIIIFFLFFAGCSKDRKEGGRKDIMILENIAKQYVDKHEKEMEEIESDIKCGGLFDPFVYVELEQQEDYNGNRLFLIYINQRFGRAKNPSKIVKYKNRYIVLRLKDTNLITREIPKELINDYPGILLEGYWAVLMCKENRDKYIVVDNDCGYDLEGIDQLKNFDCGNDK